jgi:hypothetical protein
LDIGGHLVGGGILGVAGAGRGVDELTGGLGPHRHVGEHLLDHLEGVDRRAELLALRGVALGVLERSLGQPHRLRGHAGTREVEGHHRVLEAEAELAAEDAVLADLHAVKARLDDGHAADAHLVLDLADREALVALLDQEGGDAARAAGRVGDREDGVEIRGPPVGGPLLLAVDDPLAVRLVRLDLQAARVRAGGLLREAEGDARLAAGDLGQVLLLLLLVAAEDDRERAQGVDGEEHADAAAGARELLDHQAEVEDATAPPAVLLGKPEAHEAGLGEGLLHLPGVLLRRVPLPGAGAHHVVRDLAGLVPPGQGLGAEQLVQRSSPSGWVAGQNIREPDIIAAPRSPPRYPAAADSTVSGCREGAFSIR